MHVICNFCELNSNLKKNGLSTGVVPKGSTNNADELTKTGLYVVRAGTTMPTPSIWHVFVFAGDNEKIVSQFAKRYDANGLYTRHMLGENVWSEWKLE